MIAAPKLRPKLPIEQVNHVVTVPTAAIELVAELLLEAVDRGEIEEEKVTA